MFENKTIDWSKFTVLTKFKQMDLDTAWVSCFLNSKLGLPDTQVTQTFKSERGLELEYFNDYFRRELIWQYIFNQNFHQIYEILSKYSNGCLRISLFKLLSRTAQLIVYLP